MDNNYNVKVKCKSCKKKFWKPVMKEEIENEIFKIDNMPVGISK